MDPAHAVWIGGPPECAVEELARALARRLERRLYSLDEHAADHELRLPADTGDGSLASVVARSRHRFRLVLEDLREWPEEGGLVVAGPGLFPTTVSAVLRKPEHALFLLPAPGGDWTEAARTVEREARDLRLSVFHEGAEATELVELAAEQVRRGDDDPHHEAER